MRLKNYASLAAMILAASLFSSCSRLKVESNPPGARLMWSRDGLEPYRPWPPNGWETRSTKDGNVTPFGTTGLYQDTFFLTVEKDGYRRPLPKPVQLYSFHREKLSFDLPELPETTSARMHAMGKLYYKGDWVDPEAAGVVEYEGVVMPKDEAFRRSQAAQGLVEYKGEWYTKEKADQKLREDMAAQGLVELKGRWVSAEQKAMEESVDAEVAAIKVTKTYPDLPAPKIIGASVTTDRAQIQLYNSTGQKVRFLFSGPQSAQFVLDPYRSTGVKFEERILLPAGRYDIAVVPTGQDASGRDLASILGDTSSAGLALSKKPVWASWPVANKTQYSFNYTGMEGDLQKSLSDFNAPPPEVKIDVPTIEIPDIKLPEESESERYLPRSGSGGGGRRR
ncbi:hypothetical protein IT570_05285 [Candidatus Sumerlaeota bacterium]|nr:hypothetical protein [Candidatus Sumerlaeota bacterium]